MVQEVKEVVQGVMEVIHKVKEVVQEVKEVVQEVKKVGESCIPGNCHPDIPSTVTCVPSLSFRPLSARPSRSWNLLT